MRRCTDDVLLRMATCALLGKKVFPATESSTKTPAHGVDSLMAASTSQMRKCPDGPPMPPESLYLRFSCTLGERITRW